MAMPVMHSLLRPAASLHARASAVCSTWTVARGCSLCTSSARLSDVPFVAFNREKKKQQRNAAALRPDSHDFDYVRDEVAARIVDRLNDITRTFPDALDLGANTGNLARALASTGAGGIQRLHMLESSKAMLQRDAATQWGNSPSTFEIKTLQCDDEEAGIPLPDRSMDLVLSSLSLHWINDLPRVLAEVRRVLKPDGAFLAACLGGETLCELRSAFVAAEMERCGGVSPHISPMLGVADAGNLLTGAGFGLPTADSDQFTMGYRTPAALLEHLQGMGENGAAIAARCGARRDLLMAAMAAYSALYAQPDGSVPATFEVVYMIGWEPALSQPAPLARGSVPKGFFQRNTGAPVEGGAKLSPLKV